MTGNRRTRPRAPWFARRRSRAEADAELGTPWTPSFEASATAATAPRGGRRGAADRDLEIVNALGRVADTFARIADGLDADRRERRAQFEVDRYDRRRQLDAVEFLLREMAIGIEGATAVPPVVVGGSIEPDTVDLNAFDRSTQSEPELDLADSTEAPKPSGSLSEG